MKKKTIIALCGYFGSGKDQAAEIIKEKFEFVVVSTSDILREYIRSQGLEPNRLNMNKYGKKLRKEKTPSFLFDSALDRAGESNRVLITGLRSPAEAEALHRAGGVLVEIVANENIRWDRIISRGREGDFKNLEDLKRLEREESYSDDLSEPSSSKLSKMADCRIENNGSLEVFRNSLYNVVNTILEGKEYA